jgi:hypothetical protein
MTDPIVVPVSAPGATEASAQVRQFAGTVAQAGAASNQAASGHAAVAKATQAVGQAAEGAAAKTQIHVRTLDEEIVRLKRLEEQALVTASARKRLGESANAADIGAIRRFTRNLGGVGREAGRGVSEGIEGAEGSGLRSTLGFAGAGVAGGMIAYEAITHAVDAVVEAMHREIDERYENINLLEEANKRGADIGKGALDKYGDALASIAAGGGETSVKSAKDFAERNKDDATGIETYDLASKHFGPGTERGMALQAAEMYHQAGGGTLKEGMEKLTPERLARMLAGGGNMAGMVGEMFGDGRGMGRLSADDIEKRIANRANSPTAQAISKLRGLENAADLGGIDKIPLAEGTIRQGAADRANPAAAMLHDADVKGRPEEDTLRADAELEKNTFSGMGYGFGGVARAAYTSWRKIGQLFDGTGTANDRLDRHENEKMETADKLMPGLEAHLRDIASSATSAADAVSRHGGGAHAGSTP